MQSASVEATPDTGPAIAEPQGETAPERKRRTKRQPPYAVVLHNDDLNSFEYVVSVLQKIFHYDKVKAHKLTLEAHQRGRSIVWSGMREVAELKADQIRSCGADPVMKHFGAGTLRVTVEPQPGE